MNLIAQWFLFSEVHMRAHKNQEFAHIRVHTLYTSIRIYIICISLLISFDIGRNITLSFSMLFFILSLFYALSFVPCFVVSMRAPRFYCLNPNDRILFSSLLAFWHYNLVMKVHSLPIRLVDYTSASTQAPHISARMHASFDICVYYLVVVDNQIVLLCC